MRRQAHKGRGAVSNTGNRFAAQTVELDVDVPVADDMSPATQLHAMPARSIISHNQSPDIPFDHSINPYLGCEHGCVYCYARPSHSYLDLSPGLDFETQIFYKPNAAVRLTEAWQKPAYVCQPITIGANTDPYQPAEKQLGLTRSLLSLFLRHRHPVSIISKSVLIRRDMDLLAALAEQRLCSVAISIPTMNNDLKRVLEPRVPAAAARLRAIADLRAAGVPVSLLLAPVIPAVNDNEIEPILEAASDAGISHAAWIFLRLPHELKTLFAEWLETHLPDRAGHVLSLVRQASGGRDYDNRFGIRQRGRGAYAAMIARRFELACRRLGIGSDGRDRRQVLDCSRFEPPAGRQMSLDF